MAGEMGRSKSVRLLRSQSPGPSDWLQRIRSGITAADLARWIALAVILAATFALYAPTLNDWFQTDDFLLLRGAKTLRFPVYVREAFDFRDFDPLLLYTYRPLHFVTMEVLYSAFGLKAEAYHSVSVGLHLLNVVLVWRIAKQITSSDPVALGAAAIFGLHPIYTEVVGLVAASNSLIATTGQLVSLLAFLHFVQRGSLRWYSVSLLAYGMAIYFHQEVFLLPVVLGTYFVLTKFRNIRTAMWPTVVVLLPYGVILSIFIAVQWWNAKEGVINNHFVLNIDTLHRHVGLVAMSVFPSHLSEFQTVHAVVVALFGAAVFGGLLLARRRWKIILFVIVWFHAALVLSELFFQAPAIPFLGRKLYPAAPALALLVAVTAESYAYLLRPRLAPGALYVLIAIAASLAFVRAGEFRDRLEPVAERSEQFVTELTTEYPELPEGSTLYVAQAPFSCTILICYVRDIGQIYYSDVVVRNISLQEARDPAFLATLGPEDFLFCWRCPPLQSKAQRMTTDRVRAPPR